MANDEMTHCNWGPIIKNVFGKISLDCIQYILMYSDRSRIDDVTWRFSHLSPGIMFVSTALEFTYSFPGSQCICVDKHCIVSNTFLSNLTDQGYIGIFFLFVFFKRNVLYNDGLCIEIPHHDTSAEYKYCIPKCIHFY